jgi:hypothetical protein
MTTAKSHNAQSSEELRARRRELVQSLPDLEALLHGSVIERRKRCGKPNCRCVEGELHGPYTYLSTRAEKRTRLDYVPKDWTGWVRMRVENFRRVQQVMSEVAEINRELLRRRAGR